MKLLVRKRKGMQTLRTQLVDLGFFFEDTWCFFKPSLARLACGKSLMNQLLATELSETTWWQKSRNILYLDVVALQWNTTKKKEILWILLRSSWVNSRVFISLRISGQSYNNKNQIPQSNIRLRVISEIYERGRWCTICKGCLYGPFFFY